MDRINHNVAMANFAALMMTMADVPDLNMTTPDNGKGGLVDWHDPEKITKAEKKRAMRKSKRLKHRNI